VLCVLCACATGQYQPLAGAERDEVEQIKENVYRVEYRVSSFTSQEQLDAFLRRRCAELTLREGYDFFRLAQRADVLALSRRTSMTVVMYKGQKPVGATDLYDAKEVLTEAVAIPKQD
jgi:CO dehydrogenase/acetyl-CoA synthase beta subunit